MNFQQSKSPLGITKAWSSGRGLFTYIGNLNDVLKKSLWSMSKKALCRLRSGLKCATILLSCNVFLALHQEVPDIFRECLQLFV